ncbi:hypothetical protein ANCCEY_04154 [Ancylostoma ceylanicum]|uniref:Uncharacterized protein n=1 Tax=Ancylostoma ceylanicum TaxID=53326 RepID=A0A0D6LZS1_9BILA|nr:hypothetical protein ANCCEY_04154 [Ancylostoma ceylanicum]
MYKIPCDDANYFYNYFSLYRCCPLYSDLNKALDIIELENPTANEFLEEGEKLVLWASKNQLPRRLLVCEDFRTNERAPFLENAKEMTAAPKDRFLLVYFIAMLHGIGVLMPWNMFITIAPQYYVDYWFSPNNTPTDYSKNFMSSLGIASQLPNVLINIINTFAVIG